MEIPCYRYQVAHIELTLHWRSVCLFALVSRVAHSHVTDMDTVIETNIDSDTVAPWMYRVSQKKCKS